MEGNSDEEVVGSIDGWWKVEGASVVVGESDGKDVECLPVGTTVGDKEGSSLRDKVGFTEGIVDGIIEGLLVGDTDGIMVGEGEGTTLGAFVGEPEG